MVFQNTTRAQFKAELTAKIGDSLSAFWTDAEKNLLLNEALYTFGSISQYWKDFIGFNTVIGTQWYNLATDLTSATKINFTKTYQDILDLVNSQLMENISDVNQTGNFTTYNEVLGFITNKINLYQLRTSLVVTRQIYTGPLPNTINLDLDNNVIALGRVAFEDDAGNKNNLQQDDEPFIEKVDSSKLYNSGQPQYYTTILSTQKTIFIYPAPNVDGKIHTLSVKGIDSTLSISKTSPINLPDCLFPYIKWGVLADIFSKDGVSNNPDLASYCSSRWEEGIQVGIQFTSILTALINGRYSQIDAPSNIDSVDLAWENKIGKPYIVLSGGYNIVALNRVPDAIYSILFRSVVNPNIPANDADFINIKEDYIEPLLDYCVHLAMIKDGFQSIQKTMDYYKTFLKIAVENNQIMAPRGISYKNLLELTKMEEAINPRNIDETPAPAGTTTTV